MSSEPKNMPQALDAERAMLGSMMQSGAVLDEYGAFPADAFYLPSHRTLFRAMQEMRLASEPVDLVTVTQKLSDVGTLEKCGGASWVTELWSSVATFANAAYYAEIVREKAMRRRVLETCRALASDVLAEGETSADALLEQAEQALMRLRIDSTQETHMTPLKDALAEAVQEIEHSYRNRGGTVGYATGLVDFDRMTGGLREGQLVVIAARPSQGKTCLLMQIARKFSDSGPVAVFSLEMSDKELAGRLLCNEGRLNLARVRDGFLGKSDFSSLSQHFANLRQKPIYIDDTAALSVLDFRSRARRAVVRYGARAIFVDYLQLMRSTSKRAEMSRAIEVAEISMALKSIAKELNVPVIAAAQLNRDADQRSSSPKLSDLRESGQIEQDADLVCMLHRPKKDADEQEDRELCSLIIAKQRNGPVGEIKLRFRGEYALFESVTEAMYSNNPAKRQEGRK